MRLLPRLIVLSALALHPEVAVADEPGQLLVMVVDAARGRTVPGLSVWIDGQRRGETDADGAAILTLPAGTHTLGLRGAGWQPYAVEEVQVVSGQQTELIVRLLPDSRTPSVVLEAPAHAATATVITTSSVSAPSVALRGRVLREDKSPVSGASVVVRGQAVEARTDADGRFELMLPAGRHELTLLHPDLSTLTERGVLAPGEVTLTMVAASAELEELVVLSPKIVGGTANLLEERQQASTISDSVGAEAMAKQGDSDAAGALSRVTGLTIVGGRYVYVRGLGERYSSTLLDGSTLPSPEPEGRVVPLDMFPASVLESVVVEKTYGVDRPGEFGGGTVILRTREPPKVFGGKLSLSLSTVLGTTFADGVTAGGGDLDFLGIGAGARALPDEVAAAAEGSQLREGDLFSARGFTKAELERFGELLDNDSDLGRSMVLPDLSLSGSLGGPFRLMGQDGGWLAGLVYRRDADCCDRVSASFVGENEELRDRFEYDERGQQVTLSGVLGAQLALGGLGKLRYTGLVNRISDSSVSIGTGRIRDGQVDERVYDISWKERMLISQQLRAEHPLAEDWSLAWRYMLSVASLDDPDHRSFRYELEPTTGVYRLSRFPDNNLRVFTTLSDVSHDLSADVTWDWGGTDDAPRRFTAGAALVVKSRDVRARRFKFNGSPASEIISRGPDEIFDADTIAPGSFELFELSRASDTYTGDQLTVAGFAASEWSFTPALRVSGGVRVEYSRIGISTYDPFAADLVPLTNELTGADVLPSLGVAWEFVDDMYLRGGIARSVSRPNFRERSPARIKEQVGLPEIGGNPELQAASITHFDARWEWYPARGESISVSTFAKLFESPIEQTIVPSADTVTTFTNAEGAVSLGLELEARKTLEFISPVLSDVFLAANATLVWSQVELDAASGTQTSLSRPLQGQSPYVFNVQAGYDGVESGTSLLVLFQVFGARISDIGSNGLADYYEQPRPTLDVVFTQDLGGGFELTARAKNLIDPPHEVTVGSQVARVADGGRQLSLGLSLAL
jgi:outer membrane receptor protein involved in Fe transport